jgi:hypothetical protein
LLLWRGAGQVSLRERNDCRLIVDGARIAPDRTWRITYDGRGLVPKDAESMGREDKPLLDYSNK